MIQRMDNPLGTQSNPFPYGDTITVDERIEYDNGDHHQVKVDLTLLDYIRGEEAYEMLLEKNQFNDEPDEGFEYVLVNVNAFVSDSETEDDPIWLSARSFKFISLDGSIYEFDLLIVPDEFRGNVYNGGSTEGYIVGMVEIGEDFHLSYDSTSGSSVFFDIE